MSGDWATLVRAEDVASALGSQGLRIVDARFVLSDPGAGRQAYVQSHLPGAVHADLNDDLSDLRKTGQGRHPLPDSEAFTRRLGEWGIAPTDQVVVHDAADGSMAAARFWWLLRLMGHERVAVLDGGLAAWRSLRLPETQQAADIVPMSAYPGAFDSAGMVSTEQVMSRLHEMPGWLLDARANERYRGESESIDRVAGHVPGALNRPVSLNLEGGRFKPADTLRAELLPLLHGRAPRDVVTMCGSGVTACHLLLAMEIAGLHGARVYPGSWSGWISDPQRPVARDGI